MPQLSPVPSYTAWWQRYIGVNNLPKVATWKCGDGLKLAIDVLAYRLSSRTYTSTYDIIQYGIFIVLMLIASIIYCAEPETEKNNVTVKLIREQQIFLNSFKTACKCACTGK